jgi:nucleotide-binding universal stress UspA family protein
MISTSDRSQEVREMSIFPTIVLLATDGSDEASLATKVAVEISDKTSSELHVVYVGGEGFYETPLLDFPTLEPTWVAREYPDLVPDIERTEQELLDEEVEKVRVAGGTVIQAHLCLGAADAEIVDLAEEIGAGLVVMGSRGRGGMRRALMGSVSNSVVRHAHCPVLVVHDQKGNT